jgi:hypothetical protein
LETSIGEAPILEETQMDDTAKKEQKNSESIEEIQKVPSALTDEEMDTVAGGIGGGGSKKDSDTYPCSC